MRPCRRQPTRLRCPWGFPGKNTGVGCHFLLQCMKVKSEVVQSCPTLSDPMDCSPPGSSVHGIFQARVLEWGAIFFYNYNMKMSMNKINFLSCVEERMVVVVKVAQSCLTLRPPGLYSPWNSPGQNTGVGSLSLLSGVFPSQGSNSGLPHCRRILYQLSHAEDRLTPRWHVGKPRGKASRGSHRSLDPRNGKICE